MPAMSVGPIARAVKTVRGALEARVPQAEQGPHIDPVDQSPVDPARWDSAYAAAFASPEMTMFRDNLQMPGVEVRKSILDDLATYHDITPDEARRRCLTWEELSVQEWQAADASDDEGRVKFYRTMQSWSYDLLWWAYLQAERHAEPSSVVALRFLQQHAPARRHLDFGAGVGVTSQLFLACGWTTTLADLSSTLLDFARFRLERRGQVAAYIDLYQESLPAGAFDAITAIDTLAHVPDVHRAARDVHSALGRDGILIANFDIRAPAPETVWHLYDDDLQARYDLRRAGFRPIAKLGGGLVAYQKVNDVGLIRLRRITWDWLSLVSPPRRAARRASRLAFAQATVLLERRRDPHATTG